MAPIRRHARWARACMQLGSARHALVRWLSCFDHVHVLAAVGKFSAQNLVENIVRQKIYQTIYWKESCFALTAESLIDKAVDLKAVGGTHGGARLPSHFLCLILKMLQIQPHKEIIIEYIKNEEFKYVRVLGEKGQQGTACSLGCSCMCKAGSPSTVAESPKQLARVSQWCCVGTDSADLPCASALRRPCRCILHATGG